jgi:hypothetical protein
LVVLIVCAGAFVAPAEAHAADYVYLSIDPVRLADRWKLSAAVSGKDYSPQGRTEVVGVTLKKSLVRATESHGLRAHPSNATISFDGSRGRWDVRRQAGDALSVSMKIVASGDPEPQDEWLGCRGAFVHVQVTLQGTFMLRTGKEPFGTIRKARFTGIVIYNAGGPVECGLRPSQCTPSRTFTASDGRGGTLTVDPDRKSAILYWRRGSWYHILDLSKIDALSGDLPQRGRVFLPQRGVGKFNGTETSESLEGACRTTRTSGTFSGTFRVTFTGWGAHEFKTLRGPASYSETAAA